MAVSTGGSVAPGLDSTGAVVVGIGSDSAGMLIELVWIGPAVALGSVTAGSVVIEIGTVGSVIGVVGTAGVVIAVKEV